MKYPDMIEYITFLFSLLDEFLRTTEANVSKRGRPRNLSRMLLSSFFTRLWR